MRLVLLAVCLGLVPALATAQSDSPVTFDSENEVAVHRFVLESDSHFAPGSADMSTAAYAGLRPLIALLGNAEAPKVLVVGHTDRVEARTAADNLSEERAFAVARYLKAQSALPFGTIGAVGVGARQPRVACAGLTGESELICLAPNRRVEVVFPAFAVIESELTEELLRTKGKRIDLADVIEAGDGSVTLFAE
jgi:outer membrane protein OmpA-like peptidoglycan-associated protein